MLCSDLAWSRHHTANSTKATYSYTVIEGLPPHSGVATQVPFESQAYKDKALKPESNSPDIGISSFYYLLQSSPFERPTVGRPRRRSHSGRGGRPHTASVPSFAERQIRVDEEFGASLPEVVRVAEGRLLAEADESEELQ